MVFAVKDKDIGNFESGMAYINAGIKNNLLDDEMVINIGLELLKQKFEQRNYKNFNATVDEIVNLYKG